MRSNKQYEIAVIGGGIVGLATARALLGGRCPSLVLLEAEDRLAAHQTGNNSGVIHSGLYYKPGSLKARNCVEGREAMYRYCAEHGIPHERCGKIVVATSAEEIPQLDEREARGRANGLQGLRRLSPEEIIELEPHARGVAGLFVAETGIVDYNDVAESFARDVREAGGEIRLKARVTGIQRENGGMVFETTAGVVRARCLVNCAGLYSDRVARMAGVEPGLKIIPFRGEYYDLKPETRGVVRNLIYPVPDPQFPFLGVHFTRMIKGGVEAGPNAVLAFKREGYTLWSISVRDLADYGLYAGFWKMGLKHWKMGLGEFYRSFCKRAFVRALQRLVPDITAGDLVRGGAGVRAQALEPDGNLVDDFRIVEAEHMVHVLNAPSPAATASLSVGQAIAAMAAKNFGLNH
ncbi:MAG: L-2-hydroxyglutarate oxidase [Kiritimatiellae bacterium]|nr:L-2-hydroxyglutarate oxidase [Kiritimatiellia bacterium]